MKLDVGPLMLQIYSLPWILTILCDVLFLSMLEVAINSFFLIFKVSNAK